MKIAIFTDVHANLPALEAALTAIDRLNVDLIVHTGDVIAIGPHPAECLDRLLQLPHKRLIMGNHDAWFAFGLPQPRPDWMSDGELAHQQWTHTQLSAHQRHQVQQWPFAHTETFAGVRVLMTHYGLDETGRNFAKFVPSPQAETLDRMFVNCNCDLVFYGHDHRASDVTGRARYVNPGSLGCYSEAVARFMELVCENGRFSLTHHAIPYNDASLFAALDSRQVPDRSFIRKNFYNGRG
ncbi:MAG: metallophosphoesterase family protein [Anaerolineales bacterium]|nr:metallophosphoesterase family protein [Anaerolineales bacterium]